MGVAAEGYSVALRLLELGIIALGIIALGIIALGIIAFGTSAPASAVRISTSGRHLTIAAGAARTARRVTERCASVKLCRRRFSLPASAGLTWPSVVEARAAARMRLQPRSASGAASHSQG